MINNGMYIKGHGNSYYVCSVSNDNRYVYISNNGGKPRRYRLREDSGTPFFITCGCRINIIQ